MKTKVIDVAVFLNDSVESKGKDKVGCGCRVPALVWLGLADGWEGTETRIRLGLGEERLLSK